MIKNIYAYMSIPGGDKIFQVSDFNLVSDCVFDNAHSQKKKTLKLAVCIKILI